MGSAKESRFDRSTRGRWGQALALFLASWGLVVAGCGGQEQSHGAVVRLLEFPQAGSSGVRLNEALQFQFSRDLDRSSITGSSFVIEDSNGRRARGTVLQRASTLQFVPDLPLRSDLTDAGLLPGRTYTVRLLGFPASDGIRGLSGEPLFKSVAFQFKTAGREGDEAVFLPPISGGLPLVLRCQQQVLNPLAEIRLETIEAVDPRSVGDNAFELISLWGDGGPERIALHAEVEVNRADRAVILLRPILDPRRPNAFRALETGRYYLAERSPTGRFKNLGGVAITPIWSASGEPGLLLGVGEREVHSLREEFDDLDAGSPMSAVGVDGTAFFDGSGEVRMRYPAAAGSGKDGWVEDLGLALSGRLEGAGVELQGTRVALPARQPGITSGRVQTLDLSGLKGTVVIRAQGSLEIDGNLERRAEAQGPSIADWIEQREKERFEATTALRQFNLRSRNDEDSDEQGDRAAQLEDRLGEAQRALHLSEFIEDAASEGMPWTILVAGGDVRISGQCDVEGELLIAAGGWVRVPGRVRAGAAWTTPQGGGNFGVLRDEPNHLPLLLDPPLGNPLREPLTVALISRSIRPSGSAVDWLGLTTFAVEGHGHVRVRAIGERLRGNGPQESFGPVDDLGLLRGCDSVRLVIELRQDPDPGFDPELGRGQEPWDPPRVQAVEVSWKRSPDPKQEPDGTGAFGSSGR